MQIDRRVRLHRAADVTHQHDAPGASARAGPRQPHRLPARRARSVHGPPQVDPLAVPVLLAAHAPAARPAAHRPLQPRSEQAQIIGVEPLERLVGAGNDAAGQQVGHRHTAVVPPRSGHRGPCGPRHATALDGRPGVSAPTGSRRRRCVDPRLSPRRGVQPEHGIGEHGIEHRVERGEVVDPVHQRQPRGPVDPGARMRRQPAQSLHETRRPTGRHDHARRPQPCHQRHRERRQVDAAHIATVARGWADPSGRCWAHRMATRCAAPS